MDLIMKLQKLERELQELRDRQSQSQIEDQDE